MQTSWNVRKYREGDEQGILELLDDTPEYWEWKYKKNPAGAPVIWGAEQNNKIIGFYGITPIRMKLGYCYVNGSIGSDAETHPEYHGRGIFSSIVNRCYWDAAESDLIVTYGFANARLGPIYKRYEFLGHICFFTDMVKVLNWSGLLARYLRPKPSVRAAAHMANKVAL